MRQQSGADMAEDFISFLGVLSIIWVIGTVLHWLGIL